MSGSGGTSWDMFLDDADDHLAAAETPISPAGQHHWSEQPAKSQPLPTSLTFPPPLKTRNEPVVAQTQAPKFVQVKFHEYRTQIVKNGDGLVLVPGEFVITEADRGCDIGEVLSVDVTPNDRDAANAKPLIRKAAPHELKTLPMKKESEIRAKEVCQEKADEMGLPMTVLATEFQFDGKKLTVYFSASQYVDFRSLVHNLFCVFGTRIWMVWYDGEAPVRDVFTHTQPHIRVPRVTEA